MMSDPYSWRYAWAWTSSMRLASPYGALVSSGYPSQSCDSRVGVGAVPGYEQAVPTTRTLSTPCCRHASSSSMPITALS